MHKQRAIKTLMVMTIGIFLSACQSGGERSPVVTPQKMICGATIPAQITLFSPEIAVLVFEGKSYDLDRIITASGVKYGNRSIEYWNKGVDAMITRKDGTVASCMFLPKSGI